eukprot:gb/GECG01010887.1/.p1 GENE.gb/GECG01010887.1/~~gb/GECG01010887.1/.p1  ORF type:complete len:930 (+),score=86.01 gb/GECG01010887.1/:1-2790(+)
MIFPGLYPRSANELFWLMQVFQESVAFLNKENKREISDDEVKGWKQCLLVSSVLFKKLVTTLHTLKCKEMFTVSLCWKYFLVIQELFNAKYDIIFSARLLFAAVAFLVAEHGVMGDPRLHYSGIFGNLEALGVSLGGPSVEQGDLDQILRQFFDKQCRLVKDGCVDGSIKEYKGALVLTKQEETPTADRLQVYTSSSNIQKLDIWLCGVFPQNLLNVTSVDTMAQLSNCEGELQVLQASAGHSPSKRKKKRRSKRTYLTAASKKARSGSYSRSGTSGWLWANTASPYHSCRTTSLRHNVDDGQPEYSEDRMNSDSMENLNWAANVALTDQTQALNEFSEALGYLVDSWASTFCEPLSQAERDSKVRFWGDRVAEEINNLSRRVCDYYRIRPDASRDFRRPSTVSILNRTSDKLMTNVSRASTHLTVKQSAAKMVLDTTTKLYYLLLPVVVYEAHHVAEERDEMPDLFHNQKFLASLFCLCFDALSYAYCVHLHDLPELRAIFDVEFFELWKAAEPVQRADFFIPVTVRRHIAWVEEQLMERYVFQYSKQKIFPPLKQYMKGRESREISTAGAILNQFTDICRRVPASVGLLLKKVSRLGAGRVEFLVDTLNLPSRVPEDHPHVYGLRKLDVGSVVWTVFMHCISNVQVFCDFLDIESRSDFAAAPRTIDQLVLCCVYGTCKLLNYRIAFADVVKGYERFAGTGPQASSTIYNLTLKVKNDDGTETLSHGENIISLYNKEFLGLTRGFLHIFKGRIVGALERGGVSALLLRLPRTTLDSIPTELGGQSTKKQLMRCGPVNLLVSRVEDKAGGEYQHYYNNVDIHLDLNANNAEYGPNSGLLALSSAAENALRMKPCSKRPREDEENDLEATYAKSVRDSPVSVGTDEYVENINPSNFHTPVKKSGRGSQVLFRRQSSHKLLCSKENQRTC